MKSKLISIFSIMVISLFFVTDASAVTKAGTTCKKLGLVSTLGEIKFTCIKVKGKLVWNKGVLVSKVKDLPKESQSPSPIASVSASPSTSPTQQTAPSKKPTTPSSNPFQAEVQKALDQKLREESAANDAIKKIREKYANLAKIKCNEITKCEVGNTGPGGGIVFYIANAKQPWGTYLEMAPFGWYSPAVSKSKVLGVNYSGFGDPSSVWCDKPELSLISLVKTQDLKNLLGSKIGNGKSNSDLMLAGCAYGAAHLAASYKGGDKTDWYLPSINELNEMCKFSSGITTGVELFYLGGTESNGSTCGTREMQSKFTLLGDFYRGNEIKYWSSSESSNNRAWCQRFDDLWTSNWEKFNYFYVRPIRSF